MLIPSLDTIFSYNHIITSLKRGCQHSSNKFEIFWQFFQNSCSYIRITFPVSKSSIKTKTVLTMTDMTESTKPLAFKRQKKVIKLSKNFLAFFAIFKETNSKSGKIYLLATMSDENIDQKIDISLPASIMTGD